MGEKTVKPTIKQLSVILAKTPLVDQRKKTVKPTIKQLSVILAKRPLEDQRNENRELLQHKIESTHSNNTSSKQDASCGKKTSIAELKNIYKKHNITYKQCKVILEKLDLNKLKLAQEGENGNKLVAVDENVKNDYINSARQMVYDMPDKQLTEDKDDLYVFDEVDSESFKIANKAKRNRKKKVKSSKNAPKINAKKHRSGKTKICNTYDAAMQEILQKLLRKVNDHLKTKSVPAVQNQTSGKHDTNHLFPLQKDLSHIDDVDESNNKIKIRSEQNIDHLTPLHQDLSHIDDVDESNHDIEISSEHDINPLTPLQEDLSYDECNNDIEISENTHLESHKENEHRPQDNNSEQIRFPYSPIRSNRNTNIISDITLDESHKENEHRPQSNNSEQIRFPYSPIRSNRNINIISDITLDGSDDSFLNDDLQPNANSTVLMNKQRSPPWRYSDYVTRNPHYLSIKKTALPCLQQDMIIDHNQLKRIEEHFAEIPRKPRKRGNKPSPIKDSGLFHDTIDKENVPQRNLFEMENFVITQIKSGINKENRNILGAKVLNEINIINIVNVQENNAVEIPSSPSKVPKLSNVEKPDKHLETSENSLKEPADNNFGFRLFEDEEPVINFDENSKIYIPRVRKKKKLYDHIEDSGHDKHKREMTKKEEADLEQWAAKFNSLCDDIEKYNLEIE